MNYYKYEEKIQKTTLAIVGSVIVLNMAAIVNVGTSQHALAEAVKREKIAKKKRKKHKANKDKNIEKASEEKVAAIKNAELQKKAEEDSKKEEATKKQLEEEKKAKEAANESALQELSDGSDTQEQKASPQQQRPQTTNPNYSGAKLSASAGTVMGPSGKETYYNLNMSGVVSIMHSMGNTDEYWIRDDGVKMLGNYVMVAANLSIRPRGSLVETSLGTGIVCDTGSFIYSNPTQLDIATNW